MLRSFFKNLPMQCGKEYPQSGAIQRKRWEIPKMGGETARKGFPKATLLPIFSFGASLHTFAAKRKYAPAAQAKPKDRN